MRQRLIVRLNSDPQGAVQWIRLDAEGKVDGQAERGGLEAAAAAASGRRVVAIAPAVDVALHTALIPTQSRQRMLKAVPYALEDQLAEDIDKLHFALGRKNRRGEIPVAVITKARLEAWLEAAAEAGLDIDQIYPEPLALPHEDDAWTVLIDEDRCIARTDLQAGFGGDADNVALLLEWALDETDEDERPQRLLLYADGTEGLLGSASVPVEPHRAGDITTLLATSLDERTAIGLRSGPYAPQRRMNANWRRWMPAAALLLAWVLLDTGAALLQQWRLGSEVAAVEDQISQLYQKAFPGAGPLINPRQQIESRLNALRGGGGGNSGLLPLLDKVAPVLAQAPNVQISGLNYRDGNLSIELYAGNLQDVDRLQQRLAELPDLSVQVESARAEGDRVQGRLRVEASS